MAICHDVKDGAGFQLFRFRSGQQVLLNVLPEFRWMTISGAPEFFADASRDRAMWFNQVRRRRQLLRVSPKLNQPEL